MTAMARHVMGDGALIATGEHRSAESRRVHDLVGRLRRWASRLASAVAGA